MTRKDYELIAQAVRVYRDHIVKMASLPENAPRAEINKFRLEGAEWTITYLANALEAENPRFNKQRFLMASGLLDEHMSEIMAQLA